MIEVLSIVLSPGTDHGLNPCHHEDRWRKTTDRCEPVSVLFVEMSDSITLGTRRIVAKELEVWNL